MTTTFNKAISLIATMVMAFVLMIPAGAAYAAGTGTITIVPPAGTASSATNTYKVYKVFDANGNGTNISYKLSGSDTLSQAMKDAGFSVDSAGNVNGPDELNQAAIKAIADYVTADDLVATVTSTGENNAVAEGLDNGYYYITTSTGTAVSITSTNPDAAVQDKNTVPDVNKKIASVSSGSVNSDGMHAIAQAGAAVSYQSEITVPKNTKNLKFSDTMDDTQTLDASSVAVTVNGVAVDAGNYTLTTADHTFSIAFKDSYISALSDETVITVTYNATVNSSALSSDPSTNKAKITYGDNDAADSSGTTKVYNAKITVNKEFENLTGTLPNNDSAQFVLKKGDQYYSISNNVVSWVDSIDNATKLTFTQTGHDAFTGLSDGEYTLVESKTPAGYQTAPNRTITIDNDDYEAKNLEQEAFVENETGTSLPSTGGMGTTLLYVVGAALVIGAGVLLITRRKMQE